MKKIFFRSDSRNGGSPFWQPWGCLGYMFRLLGFLLLLALLLLLLGLFMKCESSQSSASSTAMLTDPDWNRPIEGGEEVGLPSPEDNILPPFDEETTIPNPENGGATEIYPNLLFMIFDSEADDNTYLTFAEKFSAKYPAPDHKIKYYNTGSKTCVLEVPEDKRDLICENLPKEIPEVEFYVIPVEVMSQYAEVIPDDPAFDDADKSWYFEPIQMPEAWDISQGSPDVIVGIVDSYMDLNHPELKGDRCIYPYSVVNCNTDVAPPSGTERSSAIHGTLVTSIAVGNMNNGQGSSGIAPKCKFIPVSLGTNLNTITMVEGLLYCMYHGASVINLSMGTNFRGMDSMPIDQQIRFSKECGVEQAVMWDYVFALAEKRNVTIVWAAGNDNCYGAMDASKRNVNTVRVAAVDRTLKRAHFSNYGNLPAFSLNESTISAPGVDIWGAVPFNSYTANDGTSFSAPIIAGVVALMKSQNKDLTNAEIIDILQDTGKPITGTPGIGNLVQVKEALIKTQEITSSETSR